MYFLKASIIELFTCQQNIEIRRVLIHWLKVRLQNKCKHWYQLVFYWLSEDIYHHIHGIICVIFKTGRVPDNVKTGILSPVFKNKGENINVKNYRGITVLPVISKIIDSILKSRIRKKSDPIQCTLQSPCKEDLLKSRHR